MKLGWSSPKRLPRKVTYFRNDYQNKIVAGDNVIGQNRFRRIYILKWQNGGKALRDGIEASMSFPTGERSSELEYQCHMDDHF